MCVAAFRVRELRELLGIRTQPLWSNSGYPGSFGDVRVYADINYVGASTCAPNGGSGNIPSEWNDRISSHKWVTNCGF